VNELGHTLAAALMTKDAIHPDRMRQAAQHSTRDKQRRQLELLGKRGNARKTKPGRTL
jgi:hypothetical protein